MGGSFVVSHLLALVTIERASDTGIKVPFSRHAVFQRCVPHEGKHAVIPNQLKGRAWSPRDSNGIDVDPPCYLQSILTSEPFDPLLI